MRMLNALLTRLPKNGASQSPNNHCQTDVICPCIKFAFLSHSLDIPLFGRSGLQKLGLYRSQLVRRPLVRVQVNPVVLNKKKRKTE